MEESVATVESYSFRRNANRYPQRTDGQLVDRLIARDRKIKVAVMYAVLYRFRMPIFRRISANPALNVKIFTSTGIARTKLENSKDLEGIDSQTMWTYAREVVSTNRKVPLIINPTLVIHLFKFRPDVLLIQGGMVPNNLLTLLYAKLTGTPIVWWSLGRVSGRNFKGLSALYQRLNQWIERKATCYAGYSSESVNYFLQQGYEVERCFNLVNVVDTELVKNQIALVKDRVEPLRQSLGLEGKQVILFVGSVVETKRLDVLIRAYSRCPSLMQDTVLLVVGDGPDLARSKALTSELGMQDSIVFTGSVYDGVAAYFQLGDIMVLPGTGGLAISESMTHGLPVICSIGDGVEKDLIDEGINGYIVEPGNVDELASRLEEICSDQSKLKKMGLASREIIDNRANIAGYINEMLSAISYSIESKKVK